MPRDGRVPRLALPLGLLLGALLAACGPDEATFRDRPATAWADELGQADGGDEAERALTEGGARAVPVLVEVTRVGEERARLRALGILATLGPDAADAVPALTALLDAEDLGTRGMAAIALGRIGQEDNHAIVRLDEALSDPSGRVRVAAALAIWGLTRDGETAHDVLLRELDHGSVPLRVMVVEGLRELGAQGVDLLVVALGDEHPVVRATAARSLAAIGPPARPAVMPLVEMLAKEQDEEAREAAAEALAKLGG